MTSYYDSYDYYKKMLDLQEKLRKSEEERIRLDERFKILAQESRNRRDACMNRLRLRYIEFLEEQRIRDEKNHKILEALDRVDDSLALMTKKTNRLNAFRERSDETYLHRTYKVPNTSRHIMDDSKDAEQYKNTYLRRNAGVEPIQLSPNIKSTSPLEPFSLHGPVKRPISPWTCKLTQPSQSDSSYHSQHSVAQPKTLDQQSNRKKNTLQVCQTATRSDTLPGPIYEQRKSYNRVDPDPYISHASSIQRRTSNLLAVPYSNKFSLIETETCPSVSEIAMEERADSNSPQYKYLDVVPSRQFTPMAPEHYVYSPTAQQRLRLENDKVLESCVQRPARTISNALSTVCATGPVISGRDINGAGIPNKSFNYPRATACYSDYHSKKPDYCPRYINHPPTHLLTTSDVENMLKRYKRFMPKSTGSPRLSVDKQQSSTEGDKDAAVSVASNELDRCMDNIRKLHRDLEDERNFDEVENQERKKDGTILRASLPDDSSVLFADERANGELPEEVKKVLALADDLASRAVDLNVANDSGSECNIENQNLAFGESAQKSGSPLERGNASFLVRRKVHETSASFANDKLDGDIKLHEPKLDADENIEKPWEQNLGNADNLLEVNEQQFGIDSDDRIDFGASSINAIAEQIDTGSIAPENLQIANLRTAQQSSFEQNLFDVAEEMEPWNLNGLQKRIKEIDSVAEESSSEEVKTPNTPSHLTDENVERSVHLTERNSPEDLVQDPEREPRMEETEDSVGINGQCKAATTEHLEADIFADKKETGISDISVEPCLTVVSEDGGNTDNEKTVENVDSEGHVNERYSFDNNREEACNVSNISFDPEQRGEQILEQEGEYDENSCERLSETQNRYDAEYTASSQDCNSQQNASHDINREQNYDPDVVYKDDQVENYTSDVSYETNRNENDEKNVAYGSDSNRNYDENVTDEGNQKQGYEECTNQEYVQGSNEQHESHIGEQSDSEKQDKHDPDMQYQEDANAHHERYDSNQESNPDENQPAIDSEGDNNQSEMRQEEGETPKECEELQKESSQRDAEAANVGMARSENTKLLPEPKKKKDVIKSLLDSDTDSTIERNVSNTESDFDFN